VLRRLGRKAEARDGSDMAVAFREALVKEVPNVAVYRSHLAWSLLGRGLARRELGDPAGAAADARKAIALWDGLPSRSGREWFETACAHAALAGLAGQDGSGVSAGEGADQADQAMALLRKAVGLGYRLSYFFRTEDALDPLRGRDDFKVLMMDLAMPTDPFAAARWARNGPGVEKAARAKSPIIGSMSRPRAGRWIPQGAGAWPSPRAPSVPPLGSRGPPRLP
jgi:hypothetical protein